MFYHKGITLFVPDKVYYPREDSLLLAGVLEKQKLRKKKVLDMGCGSGFLAILLAKTAIVTATDSNSLAVKITMDNAKRNNVRLKAVKSDLFKKVKGRYDLIVFNSPYLPIDDEHKDASYDGGKDGRAVIRRFIKNAKKYLKKNGKALLLISSLTGEKEVLGLFSNNKFKTRVLTREKVPWEELIVIEARAAL